MRQVRWILLLIIAAIVGSTGLIYLRQKETQEKAAPAKPQPLPLDLSSKAKDWTWSQTSGDRIVVEVRAKDFRQIREPNVFELDGVDLKLFHKDGKGYDRVVCAKATFDNVAGRLYSEGEVEITMGLEEDAIGGEITTGKLVHIKSSGVTYETNSGKATTDREAQFVFDRGEGKSLGASYDPTTRELHMFKNAVLIWRGDDPKKSPPMQVEAGEVFYKEAESKVFLLPWTKLTRAGLVMDAKASVVTLDKGVIKQVEASEGKGTDTYPNRKLEFAANQVLMNLTGNSRMEKITGMGDAVVDNITADARTHAQADKVELQFAVVDNESELRQALTIGKSVVESRPVPRPNVPLSETKILKSEVIEMKMREGGQEIETIDTQTPGVIEFLPNRAGQRKRRVDGERIHVAYGAENSIQSFRATQASTRTENEPRKGEKTAPPSLTWSKFLQAEFAPKTSEMTKLEQWDDFRYEEGERKARAQRAILEQKKNEITLVGGSRMWDATGSTAADRIVMDQKSSDFVAEGNVTSTRLPDPKKKSGTGMINNEEPMQARAAKMRSKNKNLQVEYEGKAVMWQGANRLEADKIDIDRDEEKLTAHGNVFSQLVERTSGKNNPKSEPAKKKPVAPVFTVVRAPDLVYTDEDKLAHYKGGVKLKRGPLDVVAREVKAYLKDEEDNQSLDKAYADGDVHIVQVIGTRNRTGLSEHAEYYTGEEKIILEGGLPELRDSLKGTTKGRQLTYFSNDDRLLVNGQPAQPAVSNVRRK